MALCTACVDYLVCRKILKVTVCNFFLYENTKRQYITNLSTKTISALLANFWVGRFTGFFAPPRGFLSWPRPAVFYPCPALQIMAPPRTSLLCGPLGHWTLMDFGPAALRAVRAFGLKKIKQARKLQATLVRNYDRPTHKVT